MGENMSACGYKRLFSAVPADFRCRPESRPPCPNVRFAPDFACFTPESGPGAESPFSSAVDTYQTFMILNCPELQASERNPTCPSPRGLLTFTNS